MNESQARTLRVYLTVIVALFAVAHLAWEYTHGGIRSHHFLNRADMPSVSNAWGMLLLPLLAWVLGGIALRRVPMLPATGRPSRSVVVGFLGSLVFGAALAGAFANGYQNVSSLLFQALLVIALLFRVYRAECVLGFILGLTFTFGAVLPAVIASIVAALSALAHLVLYPMVSRVWLWLGQR